MPSGSAQLKLSPDELIEAMERLKPEDAERVTQRLLHITASRKASSLTERESQLLREVYLPKRSGFQERYDELNEMRRSFALTADEHSELLQLIDESEAFTVRRLKAIGELAQLRQMTPNALMDQLGLKAPPVV